MSFKHGRYFHSRAEAILPEPFGGIDCGTPFSRADDTEEMLLSITDLIPDGALITREGLILGANEPLLSMTGYGLEELKGKKLNEVNGWQAIGGSVARIPSGGSACFTTALAVKCHAVLRARIRARKMTCQGAEIVIVCATDMNAIGDRTLQDSAECFRSIFEAAPDLVFIKDKDLRFRQVNPAMERLLGLEASEIIGRRACDIYGAETGKTIDEWDQRVLEGEIIEEEHMVRAKGDSLTFHDVRMPLRDSRGEIIGVCGICRDITERAKTAPKLELGASRYSSRTMNETMELARQAAGTDCIVLLQGESGTGKDHLARWIHDHSRRSASPFLTINCAAVPHEIAESELFGHEPGAFTGARNRKRGLLELAEGGTLLLNEIGELPPALQSKLLVFLDRRSFVRLGGEKNVRVDARILAASHRSLSEEVASGRFLEALFYRLNVFSIQVPALRERADDIALLASEIVAKIAKEIHLPSLPKLDPSCLRSLMSYEWPGNIRELRNVLERAMILWKKGPLSVHLPRCDEDNCTLSLSLSLEPGRTLRELVQEVTESICAEAVRRAGGNKRAAARALGVSRDSLYRHIKWLTKPEP